MQRIIKVPARRVIKILRTQLRIQTNSFYSFIFGPKNSLIREQRKIVIIEIVLFACLHTEQKCGTYVHALSSCPLLVARLVCARFDWNNGDERQLQAIPNGIDNHTRYTHYMLHSQRRPQHQQHLCLNGQAALTLLQHKYGFLLLKYFRNWVKALIGGSKMESISLCTLHGTKRNYILDKILRFSKVHSQI